MFYTKLWSSCSSSVAVIKAKGSSVMTTLLVFGMAMDLQCWYVWFWWYRSAALLLAIASAAEQVRDLLLPIHNTLLWASNTCCFCTIYHTLKLNYQYIQVELGKVEGFWMLQLTTTANADQVFEGWIWACSELIVYWYNRNQSAVP